MLCGSLSIALNHTLLHIILVLITIAFFYNIHLLLHLLLVATLSSYMLGYKKGAKSEVLKSSRNLQALLLEFNQGGLLMTCCKCHILLKSMIYWLIVLFTIRSSYSSNATDVEGEALVDLKRAFNDSSGQIRDWDVYLVTPCFSWSHVTCRNGNVISLNLNSLGLSGNVSSSITKLKYLVSLELQNNSLHGELPDFLGKMENLQNLNLANNNFSGSIPISWGQLSNLKHLILRGNMISGNVPAALANITGLKELDLSSNYLTGEIPARLFSVPTFNFTGTHLICGSRVDQPCVSKSPVPVSTSKSKFRVAVTSVSCSMFILLSLGIIFAYRFHKIHKLKDGDFVDVSGEDEQKIPFAQIRRFSLREVQLATDNFSESNIIGQGGFGKVYRGVLLDSTKVAVKRLSDYYSPGGEAAFQMEVQLISVAVHKNLLRLIGYCITSSERILIYPYMKNLSVAYHLRDLKPGEKGLDWPMRKRIAFGAARGLEYLHENCNPRIIHRDLKAANILLDDNFEAVLGDFGLAKQADLKHTHVTTQVRGTMGHIAPEYLSTGKASEKTDVFGYGITLLELVTSQRAIDFTRLEDEEDVLLLDHIKKLLREDRLEDIVDRNLTDYDSKEVETIIQVALLCTQSSPEGRPAMSEVVKMLQGEGLSERWAQWEQHEEERNKYFSLMSHHLPWADETTQLEAMQLSKAR